MAVQLIRPFRIAPHQQRESRGVLEHPTSRVGIAITAFLGYYLGARLGLALTFPPQPISVLWPPNAILFAALLLLPANRWWLVLAGAFPAHLLAELQGGIPISMVACWFISNVAEAMIGATLVRAVTHTPFAAPLGVIVFVLAAFGAAVLSSFIDSAFVLLNAWGQAGYWELWWKRSISNTATSLVLVPLIVAWGAGALTHWRELDRARTAEALILYGGLFTISLLVFGSHDAAPLLPAEIYLPFPFLLWAAYRFGPRGTSLAIAMVALLAILGAGQGRGVLGTGSPVENAQSVQLFLLFLAPALLCLSVALDERRRQETSLRLSERRFRAVLEATRDAVYERDLASGSIWWGPNGLTQFGYGPENEGYGFAAWTNLIHAEDRDYALGRQAQAVECDGQLWEAEFRLLRPDGTYAQVHEQGFVMCDAEGHAFRTIGRITDITERRELDEMSQKLAHASRLTVMGELTASIAHEVNQPLSAILSNLDSAEMLLADGKDGAELREILSDIRRDDLRASEVIRHIRALANKREVAFDCFDMNELARSVVRLVAPVAKRRSVVLEVKTADMPLVWGDRIHVQQVLLNLVFNAMDAMADVPAARRELHLEMRAAGAGTIEIAVRDRGHGIAPEAMNRIFESFFTTKGEGMGLGLSIARTLVQSQGGRIWAENNPDGGATFRFTLLADNRYERQAAE